MSTGVSVDYNQLNSLLWRYRPYLDRFEFLLEVQLMVGASGRQDWQRHLADLFEEQARALATLDLEREALLGPGRSLTDLAADAPEPWGEILSEQQRDLEAITARVGRLRQRNVQALEEGMAGLTRLIDELVAAAGGAGSGERAPSGYGNDGRLRVLPDAGPNAVLFDGRL
ncbi:MAG: hypothetical protein AAF467_13935 [Actinomycetota bacterium]